MLEPKKSGRERGKRKESIGAIKKTRESGCERRSNKEMFETKKITKRKGREEAKESIGAK